MKNTYFDNPQELLDIDRELRYFECMGEDVYNLRAKLEERKAAIVKNTLLWLEYVCRTEQCPYCPLSVGKNSCFFDKARHMPVHFIETLNEERQENAIDTYFTFEHIKPSNPDNAQDIQ